MEHQQQPGTRPVLTPEDIAVLEGLCEGSSGYFYKMLDYLEERVRDVARRGLFTEEEAWADLDLALWYAYACNNIDEYESYYKAAQRMPASRDHAFAAKSGTWFYRYACALMYCGRLEEAREAAETGVALEPEYPWGWLAAGKLRSHFGDRTGALEAVDRGLALVPGDYEFTTLRREIQEGRTLEEMEFHWIDPECDRLLQAGGTEEEADKRLAVSGILCDRENLAAIQSALQAGDWEGDAPYCTFTLPYQDRTLTGRFFLSEAALSKLPLAWVRELVRRLPELDRRGRTFLAAQAGLGTEGLELQWFTVRPDRGIRLCYQRQDSQQMVNFQADFSLRQEQPALEQPTGGTFAAFVLLEEPAWDVELFRESLRDDWGVPCLTEAETDGETGATTLVFEVREMLAAVSLCPFPVPDGEAEEHARHNYLWPQAEETARRHRGHLIVSVLTRNQDPREAARLQVQLVCAACRQPGTLGIYANGTVYQPEFYQRGAEVMAEGGLPLLDLVWLGLFRREEGLCGYTNGLRSFGKDEIEVLDTPAAPNDLHGFLLDLAEYITEQDVVLRDGETIGFTEDQYLPITRSAGVWHQGMTLKIGYPDAP